MKKMLCTAAALCLMAGAAMAEFDAGRMIDVISREEGSCEIGMASRELKEAETATLEHCAIAMDGIAVIVNKENPADELTLEQIGAIYTGEATAWNEL